MEQKMLSAFYITTFHKKEITQYGTENVLFSV